MDTSARQLNGLSRTHLAARANRGEGRLESFFDYWFMLKGRWKLICAIVVVAFAWVFVASRFVLTQWYQASALIRPNPRSSEANELSSLASQVLGSGGLGSLLSSAGLDTEAQDDAEEYMSIVQGYAFTMDLLRGHRLIPTITSETSAYLSFGRKVTPWRLYETMQDRFDCKFDIETGNLTFSFLAPSREEAERILNFYIDDLRAKLRKREVRAASVAVASLKDQAANTSDNLLQTELYELLAKQIQRQQLAELQADFAMTVLDPPITPDQPQKPKVMLSSIVAAILALFLSVGAVIARQQLLRSWDEYKRRLATAAPVLEGASALENQSSEYPRENGAAAGREASKSNAGGHLQGLDK